MSTHEQQCDKMYITAWAQRRLRSALQTLSLIWVPEEVLDHWLSTVFPAKADYLDFYSHSSPSANSGRTVVSYWKKILHKVLDNLLTLTMLWANSADDKCMIFFLLFLKIGSDTSCKFAHLYCIDKLMQFQIGTHNICLYKKVDKNTLVVIWRLWNCLTVHL